MKTFIYLEKRYYGVGSPEDESESWETKKRIHLVEEVQDDEFQDYCTVEYESQDYSYKFEVELMFALHEDEIQMLKVALDETLGKVDIVAERIATAENNDQREDYEREQERKEAKQ